MDLIHPEPELLDHLVVEFGDHGHRAVEFLATADHLLSAEYRDMAVRLPETVAYCLREAMKTIASSVDVEGGGRWREASRAVAEARRRYERARGMPGEDEEGALEELLATIDDLEIVHAQEGIHVRRLIAIVVNRTGALPIAAGTEPIRAYHDLLKDLDSAVHDSTTLAEARQLWSRCIEILRQLFLPPAIRHAELDELASIERPGSAHVDRLLPLIAGPNHLRHFLRRLGSVAWLEILTDTGILDPPAAGAWPVSSAVDRLGTDDSEAFSEWLNRMYDRQAGDVARLWHIGRAAVDIGPAGAPVVLRLLQDGPSEPGIARLGVWATERLDPQSQHVESIADVVLNAASWHDSVYVDPVLKQLVEGLTEANAARRLQLLSWKMGGVEADEDGRRWFRYERSGSVADGIDEDPRDRFAMLLHAFVDGVRRSKSWMSTDEILSLVDGLPDDLRGRIRAWVLADARDVGVDVLIAEVALAIAERDPTGDDLALLDRVVTDTATEEYGDVWGQQLGPAPTVGVVARALASHDLPTEWIRAYHWAGVLPDEVVGAWSQPASIIAAAYGRPTRETLEKRRYVEIASGRSPMTSDELSAMPPIDAAAKIAAWRPDPAEWLVGARELARTLEAVVKENRQMWLAAPLRVVTELRHPTYIDHYLRAVADAIDEADEIPIGELLDVVALVRAHPWKAEPLGNDDFDYDPDWGGAEQASIDVLKKLADKKLGFAGRDDEAWAVLEAEARDRTQPSNIVDGARDPLDSAINRRCTRALDAVLSFMAHEYRTAETIRPAALALLEDTLHLEGIDGAEHRAILATRLAFLRHIAPEWVDDIADLLLGSEAPEDLAQTTADLAIKWSRPNPWLLEDHRPLLRDAVVRDVRHALDHLLIAMLWGVSGFGIDDNIAFLRQHPALLSKAGEALGRLLRHGDANNDHIRLALAFWAAAVNTNAKEGLAGFGWMAEVSRLDDTVWAESTLQTLTITEGHIDWSHKVAERAAALPPAATNLAIMNHLIRGSTDEWQHRDSIEHAVSLLRAASSLEGTPEYERLRTTLMERGAL